MQSTVANWKRLGHYDLHMSIITSEIIRIIIKDPIPFTWTVQITSSYASKHVKGTQGRNERGTAMGNECRSFYSKFVTFSSRTKAGAAARPFRTKNTLFERISASSGRVRNSACSLAHNRRVLSPSEGCVVAWEHLTQSKRREKIETESTMCNSWHERKLTPYLLMAPLPPFSIRDCTQYRAYSFPKHCSLEYLSCRTEKKEETRTKRGK